MITANECLQYKEFVDKYQSYLYPLLGAKISKFYNKSTGKIIDMGTGPGYLSVQLAKKTDAIIHAVDINPAMHNLTRAVAIKENVEARISLDKEDVHNLSYPDNFADLVVSYSCLHHWENPGEGLKECFRVLAPGGKIIILDTLPTSKENLSKMNDLVKEPEYFRFVREAFEESYSIEEIDKIVKETGILNYNLDIFKFDPEDFIECMDELENESFWNDDISQNDSVTWVLTISK
ncbi:SAM-dependent methyltransferase [Bacillus thuringiensis]|uniref:class I SAM-dependent methyltransferase n=1 Tax=Bacillus thuringiensis TaxID=1428 RepID=UPI000BF5B834|nr:class I SAM-dependent methyltransferase [Bacillus thuringiensis]PEW37831.1 SAM-dependent methyltransferase [Bacillus thuringiensis]PEY66279.1 SAM-dependent methyltransferase [Bacillus thuringiensis]PFA08023.1 SAM-dependent methyltransferase [Bacillus thuringiensis]PFK10526.1 SAM-dependent methyltransferase [Bacillus thuringiensis]PFM26002.1 SAM-dependent methyltransferase [Bacillus thuringiensis]